MLLNRIIQKHRQHLVVRNRVQGKERVRQQRNGALRREDLLHSRLRHRALAFLGLAHLGGHEGRRGLAVDERGPALLAARLEGAGELAAEEEAPVLAMLLVLECFLDSLLAGAFLLWVWVGGLQGA